jgi:hypothetical protein
LLSIDHICRGEPNILKVGRICLARAIVVGGVTIIIAKSEACDGPRPMDAYFGKEIVTYTSDFKPSSKIDLEIIRNGLICGRVYLIERHSWSTEGREAPCSTMRKLETLFNDEPTGGLDYLAANGFNCVKATQKSVSCTRVIRQIIPTPTFLLTGEKMNPDIEDTYVTTACVDVSNESAAGRQHINVDFFRVERQVH